MRTVSGLYIRRGGLHHLSHSCYAYTTSLERENSRERGSDILRPPSSQICIAASNQILISSTSPGTRSPPRRILCILCHLIHPTGMPLRSMPVLSWRAGIQKSRTPRLLLMAVWWLDTPAKINQGSPKRFLMPFLFLNPALPLGPVASIRPPLVF